jgi:hypothetical protein
MSYIFTSIYEFLNSLLPADLVESWTDLNVIMAYLLTLGILYSIAKAIINLFRKK